MQGLPNDLLIHILSFVEDASGLKSFFSCSHSYELLRRSLHLRNKWLGERTPAQVVELMTGSLRKERRDQLDLLLVSNIRAKLTSFQIASLLLLAIGLRLPLVSRLTPFCQMSVDNFDWIGGDHEDDDIRVFGFGRIEFKVIGSEDEPLVFQCIDTCTRASLIKTSVFTCYDRMCGENIKQMSSMNNRVTKVQLGAPAPSALVHSDESATTELSTLSVRRLIIKFIPHFSGVQEPMDHVTSAR